MPFKDLLPPALSTGLQFVSGVYNRMQDRKEYNRMLKYNSPKEQMKRYVEAGLSPYLIYGQGSSGNVSSPAPSMSVPETDPLGKYIGWKNFQNDQKLATIQRQNMLAQGSLMFSQDRNQYLDNVRKQLELYSDYPALVGNIERSIDPSMVNGSFRRKLNELKLSASIESVNKIRAAIEGMSHENVVKSVRSRYASEYGMVGGDWTQGLGLIKSLPSFFKSRAKSSTMVKPVLVPRDFQIKH